MEAKTKCRRRKCLRRKELIALFCRGLFLLCFCGLFAAEGASAAEQYRVFTLKQISGQQGAKFLAEAGIGTVSHIPGSDTLLVTAQPAELSKVAAILELVDSKERYAIRAILPASEAKNLPSNEKIAAEAGNILIGTFSNPPVGVDKVKAIIDVHGDAVVAIAPMSRLGMISSAIGRLQKSKPEVEQAVIFGKPSEEPVRGPSRPSEPNAVVIAPKPSEVVEPTAIRRSYKPEQIPNGDDIIEGTLPEKLTIIEFLGLAGHYLHLDMIYDPQKIQGDVTLKLKGKFSGPVTVNDLYTLLEKVLKFNGLVMTRKDNLVTIVPATEWYDIDPALMDAERGRVEAGDVIVTRIFPLTHIDTASAQNFLTAMKLGTDIQPIAGTRTLIVTDYAHRMGRIEELLELVDKPGEPKQFKYRQLRYTMAKTLAPKVKTLAEQLGTVSITISATAAAPPAPSQRRQGESEAAYRARIRREQLARQRAAAAQPTPAPSAAEPTVYLEADERTNRILMIGLKEQINIVDKLIDSLDVEQQDLRVLQLYKIEYVGADEVVEKLGELGIISGGTVRAATEQTGRITTQPGRTPTPAGRTPPTGTTTTEEGPLVEEPQVVILEGRNSLLVNATPEQHAQIAMIIGYVDVEPEETAIPYEVYPLENRDPEKLAQVILELIQETITEKAQDDKTPRTSTRSKIEEEISIVPDPNTYSLIVYASKKNQQWIASLIERLDKRRPQVLIDVTLVEITKSDEFSFDLDLVTKQPDLPGPGMDMLAPIIGTLRTDINDIAIPDRRITEATSKSGTGKGFYADKHIQALLEVMVKKGYGRVLARPKLLVNDNATGSIMSKEQQVTVREESQIVPGATPGTSTTVTKVDFVPIEAGITLEITPHISEGDLLNLSVNLERTDFRHMGDTVVEDAGVKRTIPTPPDTVSSNVITDVTVPDGTTIILGGLERLKQSKGGTKVPILGDIPIAGGLFRSIENTDDQSRLYVFVKAHILRPDEETAGESDIIRVSRKNRETFEKYEKEMQEYEDWPGIRPWGMEPRRVLEAD